VPFAATRRVADAGIDPAGSMGIHLERFVERGLAVADESSNGLAALLVAERPVAACEGLSIPGGACGRSAERIWVVPLCPRRDQTACRSR
jgi:hypothetical protein